MPNLSDLFDLITEEKKKNEKKIVEEKEKNKKEMDSLIGDSFNELFLEQINPNENIEKQVENKVVNENAISEGLLNILPNENNSDPLTPLNQNFATLDDLQNHYKLFLNRIQQQLSTIGGGGEVRLEFLDDVDRATAKTNDYYLKYDATLNKWVGDTIPSVGIVSITGITTSYQATNDDDYIGVSADVPVTIVLPETPSDGKKITVKDEGNKVSTYNITVQAGIGKSVENDSSVVMDINHQSFTYFYNGNNWYLI